LFFISPPSTKTGLRKLSKSKNGERGKTPRKGQLIEDEGDWEGPKKRGLVQKGLEASAATHGEGGKVNDGKVGKAPPQ